MRKNIRGNVKSAKSSPRGEFGASVFIVDASTDLNLLARIGRRTENIYRDFRESSSVGSISALPSGPSEAELSRAVDYAIKRIPVYLRASGRSALKADERDSLRRELTGFLKDWFSSPSFDVPLMRANAENGGFRGTAQNGPLILADNYRLILANERKTTLFGEGPEESSNSTAAKGAFAVDILLEILGLVLGLIGIGVPKSAQNGIVRIIDRMLENPRMKKAFSKLLRALSSHKWKEILEFFEDLEEYGNIYELFSHFFANLSRWDFIITMGKILAWVAAVASGAGWAAIVYKLGEVALDLIGIANKIPEIEKLGW